jgi:diphthamide synthase (EF-2-diphthine--ammonia ligase)
MAMPVPVNASLPEGTEVTDLVATPVPLVAVVGEPPWPPEVLGLEVVDVLAEVVAVELVEELEELELEDELEELDELDEEELEELDVVVPPQPGTVALYPEYHAPLRVTSTWK